MGSVTSSTISVCSQPIIHFKSENILAKRLDNACLSAEDRKLIQEYVTASRQKKPVKQRLILARIMDVNRSMYYSASKPEMESRECLAIAFSLAARAAGIPKGNIDLAEAEVAKHYLEMFQEFNEIINKLQSNNANEQLVGQGLFLAKCASIYQKAMSATGSESEVESSLKLSALMDFGEINGIKSDLTLSYCLKAVLPGLDMTQYRLLAMLYISMERSEIKDMTEVNNKTLKYIRQRTGNMGTASEKEILSLNQFVFAAIGVEASHSSSIKSGLIQSFCCEALRSLYPELENIDLSFFIQFITAASGNNEVELDRLRSDIKLQYERINKTDNPRRANAFMLVASQLGIMGQE